MDSHGVKLYDELTHEDNTVTAVLYLKLNISFIWYHCFIRSILYLFKVVKIE